MADSEEEELDDTTEETTEETTDTTESTTYTAGEYIKGIVGITISDEAYAAILYDLGISSDTDMDDLTARQRLLLRAAVYMLASETVSVASTVEDQDGNWKHKESGAEVSDSDKRLWRRRAYLIYKALGIAVPSSGPRVLTSGMKVWRHG